MPCATNCFSLFYFILFHLALQQGSVCSHIYQYTFILGVRKTDGRKDIKLKVVKTVPDFQFISNYFLPFSWVQVWCVLGLVLVVWFAAESRYVSIKLFIAFRFVRFLFFFILFDYISHITIIFLFDNKLFFIFFTTMSC